ncbi:MAG: AI-2E family transporter [Bacilli bacterium]
MNFKKDDKVNITKLNEVINTSSNILKIFLVVTIVALIVLISFLVKEWKILGVFFTVLKVISPFFIGLIIAWLCDPFVSWLKKKGGVNRIFGSIIAYILIISGIYLFLRLMIPTLTAQINDFVSSIPSIIGYCKDFIDNFFDKLNNLSGYDFMASKKEVFLYIESIGINLTTKLPSLTISIISSIIGGGVSILLGFVIGLYMLIDFDNTKAMIYHITPKKHLDNLKDLLNKLNIMLRNFVQGTLTISLGIFIVSSIGYSIAGLKAPMLFAIFCAITNIIPYVGPYIGGIPAVLIGYSMSPVTGTITLVVTVLVQLIESNIFQPIIMGKTMKLHPVVIMLGLLIFGYFFGILGMILATPIISTFRIIINFIDEKYKIFNFD